MSISSVSSLVGVLQEMGLLSPEQLTATAELESQCADARAAAQQLVARQWLTPFQVEQLLGDPPKQDLVVGPYILLERLGEGGMGQVFKARHRVLNRVVALKLIHEERLSQDPEAIQRFEREARAAALLTHPHIVLIYDAGCIGRSYFIAMEYIEGIDLGRLVREHGPLPVAQACDAVRQAALGLQHAHEHGMVHRDIKPSNLLRAASGGLVKILDMGLARVSRGADASTSLTREGVIVGTPDYIAPEQARSARKADIRSDLYSLGATFYFLLAGRPPFPEGTAIEKLLMHQLDEPTPLSQLRPTLPPAVVAVVQKLLAKMPSSRYQTPAELVEALTALESRLVLPAGSPPPQLPAAPATRKLPLPPPGRTALEPAAEPEEAASTAHGLVARSSDTAEVGQQARHLARLSGHLGAVLALAFNAARDTLASGGMDGTVRLWEFAHGVRERSVLRKHAGAVASLAFAASDRLLAAGSGSSDGLIWLGQLAGGEPRDLAVLQGHVGGVWALAFAPAGSRLASAGQDRTVRVWETGRRGRCRTILNGHEAPVRAVAFSPDGQHVASAGLDETVRLWDISRLWSKEVAVLPHAGSALSVAFTPDGELLVAGGPDGVVRIWNLSAAGRIEQDDELPDHEGPIRLVLVASDGERLCAVGEGCRATVWFQESDRVQRWLLPKLTHPSFALTHDGRYLAHGGVDGLINVFRIGEKRAHPEEEQRT